MRHQRTRSRERAEVDRTEEPRKRQLNVRLTESEAAMLLRLASRRRWSITKLVVEAIARMAESDG